MKINRRQLIATASAAACSWPLRAQLAQSPASAQPAAAPRPAAPARIVLLGTAGGPPAHLARSQPATLFQVGGRNYLIDAGENCAQQLLRAGVPAPRVDRLFLSHLHWDHTLGMDYLMATGWMMGRRQPMPVLGPPGTRDLVARTTSAVGLGEDIFRVQAPNSPPLASLYPAAETDPDGPHEILRDGAVVISAARTSHFETVHSAPHAYGLDRALAWRFDTPEGSVVFTGDTGPSANVEKLAKGCDVLVAEICDLVSIGAALRATRPAGEDIAPLVEHMRSQHLSPDAVGGMATRAGAKKLVLTHFVIGQGFDPAGFADQVKPFFKGEIVVGADLMSIPLRA
jgi:ribonuclease BN (tRNA processing enzyme)